MKIVVVNTKVGFTDFEKYGSDLVEKLKNSNKVFYYEFLSADFSNIPELFDEEDKILLYNPEVIPKGFEILTDNLRKFKNVRYILTPYSYYDGLDINLVRELGIKYRNNAGANAKSVAQHALTCALMLLGRFPQLADLKVIPDGSVLGEEIGGKTAGVIGMGNIGKELLPMLYGLGIKTVYYNRSQKAVDAKMVSLLEIFDQDLVFLTIAAGPETRAMLKGIPHMIQKQNYLIDISATDDFYDKKQVLQKLLENKFKGYALELDNPLLFGETPEVNLITTPHMAWATVNAEERLVRNYLTRTINILEGKFDEIDFVV